MMISAIIGWFSGRGQQSEEFDDIDTEDLDTLDGALDAYAKRIYKKVGFVINLDTTRYRLYLVRLKDKSTNILYIHHPVLNDVCRCDNLLRYEILDIHTSNMVMVVPLAEESYAVDFPRELIVNVTWQNIYRRADPKLQRELKIFSRIWRSRYPQIYKYLEQQRENNNHQSGA